MMLALLVLAPLVLGLVLGFVQLGIYRLLGRSEDDTPAFILLVGRGLLVVFVLAALGALLSRL